MNMNKTGPVTALLKDAGVGPSLTFKGFAAAANLADTVAETIYAAIPRATFVAEAAAQLERLPVAAFQPPHIQEFARDLTERARLTRPCYRGAVELWGSLIQDVEWSLK